ncbi:MAG: class I SAM-dependent methyltransferase [Halothiobacillus sp.]
MQMNNEKKLQEIRDFYNSIYYKDVERTCKTSRHLLKLAKRVWALENQKILDVACGTGDWLIACEKNGARPHGVDLSEKAVSVCRKCMPEGVFFVTSADFLPFESDYFNMVSCLGSLEHFLTPELAINEMLRVGKEDAFFLFLVPNKDFLTRRLGLFIGTHQVDIMEDARKISEWESLFENSGLQVERRWKDLHVLSWSWITQRGWYSVPIRTMQALALIFWPLRWQYQVYFLCTRSSRAS